MSGAFLYQWILSAAAADRLGAVKCLNDECLCRLTGHLAQSYDENATTGEVLGMCIAESTARFAEIVAARRVNQGEMKS